MTSFVAQNSRLTWDGRDAQGQAVRSGLYILRLDAESRQAIRKMTLVQ